MIKLETHCHSQGGSGCARSAPDLIAKRYFEEGYGGIVLTNHYYKRGYDTYPGETHKEKLDYYFSLYRDMQKECQKYGMKSFFGAEIQVVSPPDTYQEFMLYGFDEKFLYDNAPLFTYTQEELFTLADKNGLLLYQTHPFRNRVFTGDYRFMHGAEAFNGHINHFNNNGKANAFCEEHNLIKLSGTDFHDPDQAITGGIYIPESINTNVELKDYILSGKAEIIDGTDRYEKYLRAVK